MEPLKSPQLRDPDRTDRARRIAEAVLRDGSEAGTSELAHVMRVVASVDSEARRVAWLHEVFEQSSLTSRDLLMAGIPGPEVEAVELLTRESGESTHVYLNHVRAIRAAPGRPGTLARIVKAADLSDRLEHPRTGNGRWRPPYARALTLLEEAGPVTQRAGSPNGDEWR